MVATASDERQLLRAMIAPRMMGHGRELSCRRKRKAVTSDPIVPTFTKNVKVGQPTRRRIKIFRTMPSRKKINLEKVLASLDTLCPKCGKVITPAEMQRIDFERMKCPACGELFTRRRK
jgi:predicted RNA-binding Zn-ribbon protein involved in translation (DUF1610 family)